MAQSEHYVEYSKLGRVIKGQDKAIARSKYLEDQFPGNHKSVWGSYWRHGQWGYACCHSLFREAYCAGEAGKAAAANCAGCHGEHGEGRPELFYPMLASQHYGYLLRELDLILTGERGNSNPAMPPILKNYSTDDKQAIAAYLAQLPPPRATATPEAPR